MNDSTALGPTYSSRRRFLARLVRLSLATAGGVAAPLSPRIAVGFTTSQATTRLRTAAAIENAAGAVCQAAASLALLSAGPGAAAVKDAVLRLQANHKGQANQLNKAAQNLGADEQLGSDPRVERDARDALDRARSIPEVLAALASLENVAAATCATYASQVSDTSATTALMAVAPIHAQDSASLMTLREVALPGAAALENRPTLDALAPTVGQIGFSDAILKSGDSRPPGEGS